MSHRGRTVSHIERISAWVKVGRYHDVDIQSDMRSDSCLCFFFQAEDGIRDYKVTGVQTCALPISIKNSVCLSTRRGELDRGRTIGSAHRINLQVTGGVTRIGAAQVFLQIAETVAEIGRASCRERV